MAIEETVTKSPPIDKAEVAADQNESTNAAEDVLNKLKAQAATDNSALDDLEPGSQPSWLDKPVDSLVDVRRWVIGRSEEHTSELQSHVNLVCRLLLEKKKREP